MSLGAKLSPSICEIKGTGLNKEQQKKQGSKYFLNTHWHFWILKKKKKSLLMPMCWVKELGWEAEGN